MNISKESFGSNIIYNQILKKIKKKNKIKNLFKKELLEEDLISIRSLDIDDFDNLDNLSFLRYFENLKEIDFENGKIKNFDELKNLNYLESLSLEKVYIKGELPTLNIKTLMIEDCDGYFLNYDYFSSLKNLESLYLINIKNRINIEKLSKACPNIKTLYIHDNEYKFETIPALLSFNNLQNLTISNLKKEHKKIIEELSKKDVEIELYDCENDLEIKFIDDDNIYF